MAQKISNLLICDTGVISRMITRESRYVNAKIEIEKKYLIVITTITKIELFTWIYNYKSYLTKKEFDESLKLINNFKVLKIDRKASSIAESIAIKNLHSGIGDILTASIAINQNIKLFTINTKHFKNINGLHLFNPPNF